VLGAVPIRLKIEFLFAELWYPLFAIAKQSAANVLIRSGEVASATMLWAAMPKRVHKSAFWISSSCGERATNMD
jgi:hypothetical protein